MREDMEYKKWWKTEGSALGPLPNEDIEEFVRRITAFAWSNGRYIERYSTLYDWSRNFQFDTIEKASKKWEQVLQHCEHLTAYHYSYYHIPGLADYVVSVSGIEICVNARSLKVKPPVGDRMFHGILDFDF